MPGGMSVTSGVESGGVLESLDAEFEENLLAIQRVADIHARDEAAAESLAGFLTEAQPRPGAEIERLLSLVYLGSVTLNVSSGALDSYLSGGRPEVIENRRLVRSCTPGRACLRKVRRRSAARPGKSTKYSSRSWLNSTRCPGCSRLTLPDCMASCRRSRPILRL